MGGDSFYPAMCQEHSDEFFQNARNSAACPVCDALGREEVKVQEAMYVNEELDILKRIAAAAMNMQGQIASPVPSVYFKSVEDMEELCEAVDALAAFRMRGADAKPVA